MNPDIGDILLSILIQVVLILTNAFFAMSEIAILQSNQSRMKKLAEEGDKRAVRLLKITAEPSDFLATIQVGVTLSGFLGAAAAAEKVAGMLAEGLSFLPVPAGVLNTIALVLITLIISYFTLIFGELVPKRLAMKNADTLALGISGFLTGLYKVLKPVIRFLAVSTNSVSRLLGVPPSDDETVTQEDILMMVEEGEESGAIHEMEMQMIQNIFDLDDKPVSEVMTHRGDMTMVPADSTVTQVLSLSKAKGYSRIPVYEEDFDDIIGVVFVKDLIGLSEPEESKSVREWLRKPLFVPEGKLCSKLLLEFQTEKTHMAIVIDEYGGTAGLVTLEDVLEVIVGSIQDETDNEPPEMERLPDGSYLFEGDVPLEAVEKALKIRIPDTYDCDSIGGFVVASLDEIPTAGEKKPVLLGENYLAEAEQVTDRRVTRVRVYPAPHAPQEQPSEPAAEE